MSKIKFAVIGQGHIGKRHAEMIRRNNSCELIAVCDVLSKEKLGLDNLQEKYYNSVDDMLSAHPEIEVVNICTPNGLHATHALKALDTNKHVVVEKPMALSKSDCEKIIYKKKVIGDIYMVQLNCYWNRDDRYYKPGNWKGTQDLDGGTLFTQFSHWIDIMYWIFGDITNIQAKFADFTHQKSTDFEDSGFVSFDFVNGGMGCINYSTAVWDKNLESSLTIVGSNGSIKVGGQYMDQIEVCNIKDYKMPELAETNPANDYGSYKGSANNHNFVIENVIDTLNGINKISTNALEGLKVVDIIERIYALRPIDLLKEFKN